MPESLYPAARIWAIWLAGSSTLALWACSMFTNAGAITVDGLTARSERSKATSRRSAAATFGVSALPGPTRIDHDLVRRQHPRTQGVLEHEQTLGRVSATRKASVVAGGQGEPKRGRRQQQHHAGRGD